MNGTPALKPCVFNVCCPLHLPQAKARWSPQPVASVHMCILYYAAAVDRMLPVASICGCPKHTLDFRIKSEVQHTNSAINSCKFQNHQILPSNQAELT